MIVSTQLKHVLVLLNSNRRVTAFRLSYLLGLTPVNAEIASPETNVLIDLSLKLDIIEKKGIYYVLKVKPENNDMGDLTKNEVALLKTRVMGSPEILRMLSKYCSASGEFAYDNNSLLHRLIFELDLLNKSGSRYFLSDLIFNKIETWDPIKYMESEVNKAIGNFAEKVIFNIEYEKLSKNPKARSNLCHVSLTDDSVGYDIISYDLKKRQKVYLEVKGTTSNSVSFFITSNELDAAKLFSKKYKIKVVSGINLDKGTYKGIIDVDNPIVSLKKNYKVDPVLFKVSERN